MPFDSSLLSQQGLGTLHRICAPPTGKAAVPAFGSAPQATLEMTLS